MSTIRISFEKKVLTKGIASIPRLTNTYTFWWSIGLSVPENCTYCDLTRNQQSLSLQSARPYTTFLDCVPLRVTYASRAYLSFGPIDVEIYTSGNQVPSAVTLRRTTLSSPSVVRPDISLCHSDVPTVWTTELRRNRTQYLRRSCKYPRRDFGT